MFVLNVLEEKFISLLVFFFFFKLLRVPAFFGVWPLPSPKPVVAST